MKGLPTCVDCTLRLEAQKEHIRTCPLDNTKMKKEIISNIIIDRCNSCGGVWLDSGELEIVRKAIEEGCYSKYILGLATGMATRTL